MNSDESVEICIDEDYEGGIYISDEAGEIVCWTTEEFLEDIDAVYAALNCLKVFYEEGPCALRQLINHPVQCIGSDK